jgi:hypothetical protein
MFLKPYKYLICVFLFEKLLYKYNKYLTGFCNVVKTVPGRFVLVTVGLKRSEQVTQVRLAPTSSSWPSGSAWSVDVGMPLDGPLAGRLSSRERTFTGPSATSSERLGRTVSGPKMGGELNV